MDFLNQTQNAVSAGLHHTSKIISRLPDGTYHPLGRRFSIPAYPPPSAHILKREEVCALRKKLMSCARQTYMLMDESKFQRQSLFRINNLAEYSAVITNKVLSEEMAFRAAQTGVEWITVDTAEPQN